MTLPPSPDLGPFDPLADKLQVITEALAATGTQREVIEIVLTPAVQALGATAGIVLLVDETDQQMTIAGSQGYEDGVPTLWQDGSIEHHVLIADILRMRTALYFENAGELKAAYPELESRTGGLLPVANATLPMFLDHRPLGVIVLDFTEPHPFTPAERRFLTILSGQCAVALGRAEVIRTLEARVKEALHESELRRELAIEAAGLGTYVWYVQEDRSETDVRLLQLLGVSDVAEVSLAMAMANVIHPDDRDRYAAAATRALDPDGEGKFAIEARFVHPGGAARWIALTGQTVFEGEPRQAVRMYGTGADVTERRHAEERQAFLLELSDALRAEQGADGVANRALGLLAEHLHLDRCYIGVYRFDDDWGDFTHQVGNDRVLPVPSGVRLSDFPDALRVSFDSTLVIDDVAQDNRLSEVDRRNLGGLGMGALVAAALRKGEQHPLWAIVAISASPRQWTSGETALIEEVTERTWAAIQRVHAENAVQASQAQFRAVANLVPELLWESEPDGETTWYNGRWLEYTGQSFEQAISWGWTGAIHPEDREDSTRRYGAAVKAGQSLRQEHRIRRHDGEYRWFAVDTAPVTDEHGQIIRMYGAATDIHDLRTMNTGLEAQVENRTQRLADLNAELGNLIMRTAYNLEEPARRLSHLLEPEGSSDFQALWNQPAYDPVALSDEVKRLKGVAHDLRQLSILEEQPLIKEPLPLGELFTELSTTPSGSEVTWQIGALPIVRGDRALFRQALEVLMTFTLSETRGARYVTVSSRQIEGEVQITVQDNGTGLNGEEAATIFDLAMHTEDTVPVLEGGGLVQVRRILARHGGWAWAESQRSSGKVVLAFPKDEASELEALFRQDKPGM